MPCDTNPQNTVSQRALSLGPFGSEGAAKQALAADLKTIATLLAYDAENNCFLAKGCDEGSYCETVGDGLDQTKITGPTPKFVPVYVTIPTGQQVLAYFDVKWWYEIPAGTTIHYHCECKPLPKVQIPSAPPAPAPAPAPASPPAVETTRRVCCFGNAWHTNYVNASGPSIIGGVLGVLGGGPGGVPAVRVYERFTRAESCLTGDGPAFRALLADMEAALGLLPGQSGMYQDQLNAIQCLKDACKGLPGF